MSKSTVAEKKVEVFRSATVIRKLDRVPEKAAPKKVARGLPICSHSNKGYQDITNTERRNAQFTCGECSQRFPIKPEDLKKDILVVPSHHITPELHRYRRELERQQKVAERQRAA